MTTVALTFNETTRAAVDVAVTGLPAVNTIALPDLTAIVQRSSDGIVYRTIRGGAEAPIAAGAIATLRDWEYGGGSLNTYRAGVNQWVDSFTRTVASGGFGTNSDMGTAWTAATGGAVASVGSGRAVVTTSGANQGSFVGLARTVTDVDVSVTFRPGATATGAEFLQDVGVRYVDVSNYYSVRLTYFAAGVWSLALRNTVAGVGFALGSLVLPTTYAGATDYRLRYQADGYTFRAKVWPVAGVEPGWQVEAVDTAESRRTGTMFLQAHRATGNTNASLTMSFDDLVIDSDTPVWLDTETVTPTVSRFYLKSTARSFLNMAPMVVDYDEPARTGRTDDTTIVGRSVGIAQTELMGSRQLTLVLRVASLAEARNLECVIAAGDVMFLHVPADCPISSGYFYVASQTPRRVTPRSAARLFSLPLIECAAPGPDVVTAQATWDSVITQYGTWEAVVVAFTTWEDLLDNLIGDPAEVIVE